MRHSSAARDATCIGSGKVRYQKQGRNIGGKTIVMGMLERCGRVRATVVPDRTMATMQQVIGGNLEPGSTIYSDEHGYSWKMDEYEHEMCIHLETYVQGNVHTNGMEYF